MSKEEQKPTEDAVSEAVNGQITNGITNLMYIPEHPRFTFGSFYQSISHSAGVIFQNAISDQQQQNALNQAAANQGVMQIYSLDTFANAASNEPILEVKPTHKHHHHHDDKDKK